jgi:MscS family membrane protein
LFIDLQTSPVKIQQLLDETRKYLATIPEIQSSNVLFNDIRVQAFIVFIEFFTPNIPWNEFTSIRQKLNFFILQTMEKLEIKIAAEGKDIAIAVK